MQAEAFVLPDQIPRRPLSISLCPDYFQGLCKLLSPC